MPIQCTVHDTKIQTWKEYNFVTLFTLGGWMQYGARLLQDIIKYDLALLQYVLKN